MLLNRTDSMVIIIDNYDSFTWNLADYIAQLGFQYEVHRNDQITIKAIKQKNPTCIIISPGPGRPENAGITMDIIAAFSNTYPMLGICIGCQAIGMHYGARLIKAKKPMHGKTSGICFTSHPLFENLNDPTIDVMRYHSLILQNVVLPLQIVAETTEGEIMAVAHKTLPIAGFQFHPESILTPEGMQLLQNWFDWIAVH